MLTCEIRDTSSNNKYHAIKWDNGRSRVLTPEEEYIDYDCILRYNDNIISQQKFILIYKKDSRNLITLFHGYMGLINGDLIQTSIPLKESSILFPQDRMGFNRAGSWHLGDLVLLEGKYIHTSLLLVRETLRLLKKIHKFEQNIFMGSSMGGFAALSHSFFNEVDQVYLSVPQTTLNPNCHYFKRGIPYHDISDRAKNNQISQAMQKILPIKNPDEFSNLLPDMPYLDVSAFFEYTSNKNTHLQYASTSIKLNIPTYFHLLGTRFDHVEDKNGTYMKDMYLPLINWLAKLNVNFSIDILPIAGHDQYFFPHQIENYYIKHSDFLSYEKALTLNISESRNKNKLSYKYLYSNSLFLKHIYYEN